MASVEMQIDVKATGSSVSKPLEDWLVGVREKLTAPRSYYVQPAGNDAADGLTPATAWATLQAAIDAVMSGVDLNGFNVIINAADGSYADGAVVSGPWLGSGNVTLLGNDANPTACIISTTARDCIRAEKGGRLALSGFELRTTTSGSCVKAYTGAAISFNKIRFGASASSHIEAGTGGTILPGADYEIVGGAVSHYHAGSPGSIFASNLTITVTGTPAFSAYFAGVAEGTVSVRGCTFVGAATGRRYLAHKNGVIDVGDGGDTCLPGDVIGYTANGGVYVSTALGERLRTGIVTGNALSLGVYDVDGTVYQTAFQAIAGNDPTAIFTASLGSVTAPAYASFADPDTGWMFTGANVLRAINGGVNYWSFGATGNLIGATGAARLLAGAGNQAIPSIGWYASTGNGLYLLTANDWAAVCGGQHAIRFTAGCVTLGSGFVLGVTGGQPEAGALMGYAPLRVDGVEYVVPYYAKT